MGETVELPAQEPVKTPFFRRLLAPVKPFLARAGQAFQLGPRALTGAARGALAVAALVYLAFVFSNALGPLSIALPIGLFMLVMGALLAFLGQGLAWAIGLLARVPWVLRWSLLGGAALLFVAIMNFRMPVQGLAMALLLAGGALIGAGTGALSGRKMSPRTRAQAGVATLALAFGAGLLVFAIAWHSLWPGTPESDLVNAAETGRPFGAVTLPDPSRTGPYEVKTLTYGSGENRYRPEFGAGADLKTKVVDGSRLLGGSWDGPTGSLRTLALGFDAQSLPLNGTVWYPQTAGDAAGGPFPLVLMVHGNHLMTDFSDPGYAYLGELLASRGYIFVSVDMNFINGSVTDLFNGISGENDARGWLLLEHLRVWHAWNKESGSPFFGLVDTDRIAVGGHSRGGEAALVAAAFNLLPYLPDNFAQKFSYNYNIRAVISVAPIDGQYTPASRLTPLSGVDYFVLQGSHDADVTSFDGMNAFDRVALDPGSRQFKAALYIYRANHGQFNSVWGDDDKGGLGGGLINRAALLTGEEQRQFARVYVSAFLDASLRGERGYLPLFQDARAAGEGWLPGTVTIHRFQQAGDRFVATFEEDVNLETTSLPGGAIRVLGMNDWFERRVRSKWGSFENSAVYLGWNEAQTGAYAIYLPKEGFNLTGDELLLFSLADANQDPQSTLPKAEGQGQQPEQPRQPVDLTVVLEDSSGDLARLPLSNYLPVQPQVASHVFKTRLGSKEDLSEPVLQSYALPLADFAAAYPRFDPASVTAVRFIFDRTRRGSIVLDDVGFRGE